MLSSNTLPLFLLPAFVLPALSIPIQIQPGTGTGNVLITAQNTLNATNGNDMSNSAMSLTNSTTSASNLTSSTSSQKGINSSNQTSPDSLSGNGLTIASSFTITRATRTKSQVYAPTILNAPQGNGASAGSSATVASFSSSQANDFTTVVLTTVLPSSLTSTGTSTRTSSSGLGVCLFQSPIQSSTAQPPTVQPSTAQPSTVVPPTLLPSSALPSSALPSSALPSSVQPSTAQPSISTSPPGQPSLSSSAPATISTAITIPDTEERNITLSINFAKRQATNSSSSDSSVNYNINRDNTITDIAGAQAAANPDQSGLDSSRVDAGTVARGADGAVSQGVFVLQLVNKLASNNVHAYISGLDPNGGLVMLGQNGQWVYPTTSSGIPVPVNGDIAIPLGPANSTTPISLPGFISSARVWIADGNLDFLVVATLNGPGLVEPAAVNPNDPNADVNYAFAEFSWAADYGIYVNVSYVDFVGLPLGLTLSSWADNTVLEVLGVPANAAELLCSELIAQSQVDGQAWDQLCAYDPSGNVKRVLAPPDLISNNASAFLGYFDSYVDQVWSYYSTNDLTIDTQSTPGNVTCNVQGDQLVCAGDNRSYAKPTAADIFGCSSGPFAIQAGDNAVHLAAVPRLCAAFNRATLLLEGGNIQPGLQPEYYYPECQPTKNWYAYFVKQMEWEGMGYAFSYDDVEPAGGAQAGLLASTSPKVLTIIAGGD